jgi:hypothetical protein
MVGLSMLVPRQHVEMLATPYLKSKSIRVISMENITGDSDNICVRRSHLPVVLSNNNNTRPLTNGYFRCAFLALLSISNHL